MLADIVKNEDLSRHPVRFTIIKRAALGLLFVCATVACGKKGPPQAPLARIPAAPTSVAATRVGDDVYLTLTVPNANTTAVTPANLGSIDMYAVTAFRPPLAADLGDAAVKVASYPVRAIMPPLPVPAEGQPAPPPVPTIPGLDQGAVAVLHEALTPELREATVLQTKAPAAVVPPELPAEGPEISGPLVAPTDLEVLKRYYFVVGVGINGRPGPPSAVVVVPLESGSQAPGTPTLAYTEAGMTLGWPPSPDARMPAIAAADPSLLPAKSIVPAAPVTGYNVYEVPAVAAPADRYALTVPAALTPQPLATTSFAIPGALGYGRQRCFVVRPADLVTGLLLVGPPSSPACVTPVDTFPPAAPQRLAAIGGANVINLIWEPGTEADLGGYIVLRGVAPDGPLQALTATPIRETTYRDITVQPGVRYIYAVVAVDTATPQNVGGQSNRVEETARQ